jgi:hypothetical protein
MKKNIIIMGTHYKESLRIIKELGDLFPHVKCLFDINNRDERGEYLDLFMSYIEGEDIFVGISLESAAHIGGNLERILQREDVITLGPATTKELVVSVIKTIQSAQELLKFEDDFEIEGLTVFVPKVNSEGQKEEGQYFMIHYGVDSCICEQRIILDSPDKELCSHMLAAHAYLYKKKLDHIQWSQNIGDSEPALIM